MKDKVILWKKYKKWVGKQNSAALKNHEKFCNKHLKVQKRLNEEYQIEYDIWAKKRRKKLKEVSNYFKQPWYKKLFSMEPFMPFTLGHGRPYGPVMLMPPIYIPIEKVSVKDFMNWLAKYEYKD